MSRPLSTDQPLAHVSHDADYGPSTRQQPDWELDLGGSWVTREFQRYLRLAGMERIRFHDLRHSHASLCIAAGMHPRVIMERLGHSSISVTMDRYGHLFPAAGKEAARLLDQMFGTAAAG